MINIPYKKEVKIESVTTQNEKNGFVNRKEVILNPIGFGYHNQSATNRRDRNSDGKYIAFYHPITRALVGKVKINGNNRANTCERGKSSRQFHSA